MLQIASKFTWDEVLHTCLRSRVDHCQLVFDREAAGGADNGIVPLESADKEVMTVFSTHNVGIFGKGCLGSCAADNGNFAERRRGKERGENVCSNIAACSKDGDALDRRHCNQVLNGFNDVVEDGIFKCVLSYFF